MIPNQWYVILESKEVKTGKPVGVTRMGEKLVLWRDENNKVVCMRDRCPHRGVALSMGKLMADENGEHTRIQCPFHGLEYDGSGQCTYIPANGLTAPVAKNYKVHAYAAREAYGFIWIWWGESAEEEDLPPIAFFDALDESFLYSTLKKHWSTHYSRAIENQLDPVHLPFVHRTTIGRGDRRVVDGPIVEWCCAEDDPDLLNVWVVNRVEDGTPARRAKDTSKPRSNPSLQFRFPNIWHNWIGDQIRVFAAFVPIDDENTMMYVRMYQKVVRLPVLLQIFNLFSRYSNSVILEQDRRVVVTQQPKRSDLRIGENLFPGDGPILEYRRRRRALIEKAETGEPG